MSITERRKIERWRHAKVPADEMARLLNVTDIAVEAKQDLDSGAPDDKTAAQAVADKAKSTVARVADTAKMAAEAKTW